MYVGKILEYFKLALKYIYVEMRMKSNISYVHITILFTYLYVCKYRMTKNGLSPSPIKCKKYNGIFFSSTLNTNINFVHYG